VIPLPESHYRFCPQLIPVAAQAFDIDRFPDRNTPKPASPSRVRKIFVRIRRSGKNALPGGFNNAPTVRRPEPISLPGKKALDACLFRFFSDKGLTSC
jgi:hypothetical protein